MAVIAIVNESSDVTDKQAKLMTEACHVQLRKHVAPLWQYEAWPVRFYTLEKYAPEDSIVIMMLEDEDGADALGYHDETPAGRRYGRVFTRPVLDDGGTLWESTYSVSMVMSHEVIEAFIDPDINLWAEGDPGQMWAYEACDPVQDDGYRIKVKGTYVYVSNFVLPAWFDKQNPARTRFDYMRLLKESFRLAPGGYAVYWDGGSREKIKYGRRSSRTKEPKNHVAARSYRRSGGRLSF